MIIRFHMNPLSPAPGSTARAAFSIMEMIGVLAIMTILAGMLIPNAARRISRSNGEKEDKALGVLAEGLLRHVQANQAIPGATTWATNIAAFSGLSVDEVRYVDPSDPTSARVYLINPSFTPGTASANPIWTQTSTGAVSTANATLIILSSHKNTLTPPVSSGAASSQAVFDAIWNWSFDPATKSPPSGWPAGWTGNGEYLHVQRVSLAPLFQRVTFSNTDYPTNYPQRQIGVASATTLNSAAALDAYYLNGTHIRLYKASSAGSSLDISHTLLSGMNFQYESNRWRIP